MKPEGLNFLSWPRHQYRLSKEKWKKLQYKRVLMLTIVSFVSVIISIIVCYLVIPPLGDFLIVRVRALRNGSEALSWWEVQQVPFITNVYLWNLTNPDEVTKGISNPRFEEAGPYVFEQITVKTPIEFKKDSIVYKETTTYHYRQDLTSPRSMDDTVITLQAALYGAATKISQIAPAMMFMINSAVSSLFPGIDSIFVAVKVKEYLFDGLILNCSDSGSMAAQLVCKSLPNSAPPTIRRLPNSPHYAYSFFHHKNATEEGPNEEIRGLEDIHQLAQLIKFKGQSELNIWQPNSRCNQLRGTDTLTFAPFITKDDKIDIFIPDICQSLSLHFYEEDTIHGLTVYKFSPKNWLDGKETNPENECFCMEGKEEYCSRKGVRDISSCVKAPVVISQPHFLGADSEFLEYAQGCAPDPEKHRPVLYIEPITGAPVKSGKRIQFNMPLKRIKGFNFVEKVSEGLFPLLWMEETIMVPSEKLWKVNLFFMVEWVANFISVCIGSVMAKVFVCSLISYLYLTKAFCFRTNNRITALFYRERRQSSDIAQTST